MIARLEGVLIELAPTRLVIDVRGVGYEVLIPLSTFTELPDLGKVVALHVHTNARENAIQLFGFLTLAERASFELLLHANRVGPKLAQTIVSGIGPADLLAAKGGNAGLQQCGIGTALETRLQSFQSIFGSIQGFQNGCLFEEDLFNHPAIIGGDQAQRTIDGAECFAEAVAVAEPRLVL